MLFYLNHDKIDQRVYADFCHSKGIDLSEMKTIFIFPGNINHHPWSNDDPNISVFDWMPRLRTERPFGGGLAEINKWGIPTLSLPTSAMDNWPTDLIKKRVIDQAIEHLFEAAGGGYDFILPVRDYGIKDQRNQLFFKKPLKHVKNSEPRFWGESNPTADSELSDLYRNALDTLGDLLQLSPQERQKKINADKSNRLFQAFRRGEKHLLAQSYENKPDETFVAPEPTIVSDTSSTSAKKKKKKNIIFASPTIDNQAKTQLTYLEIDPDKPIKTVADYQASLTSIGLKPKNKPVFIFPGNTLSENTLSATLHSIKGDKAGLAAVATVIGNEGYPTLNLPIRGIDKNWETIPAQKELVTKAMADLYKAVGCHHTLVLPVRNVAFEDKTTLFGDKFLPVNPGEAPRGLEPAFWGGNQKDVNPALAKYYLEELTKLHNFTSKTPEERLRCYERGEVDKFFWTAYMDGRTIGKDDPWIQALPARVEVAKIPEKARTPSSRVKTPVSAKQQVDPVFMYIEGKITFNSYKDACHQNNIVLENKKVVFIFPGNTGHHGSTAPLQKRLFEKKGGSGLAEFTGELGDKGYPVLSLPTTGMGEWSKNKRGEKATVQKAIEDLYEAVGCGYSLALPVRKRDKKQGVLVPGSDNYFFPSDLANKKEFEPNFWGLTNKNQNEGLAAEYIKALDELANFMKLSLKARDEKIALDSNNPLFKAYKRGQASLINQTPAPAKASGLKQAHKAGVSDQNKSAPTTTSNKVNTTFPASYERLYTKEMDPLSGALALLNDYTKDNSTLKRIAFFHWNRHHVSQVNTIVEDKSINNIGSLIKALDRIALVNPEGSLSRRIAFIKEKNPGVILSNDTKLQP